MKEVGTKMEKLDGKSMNIVEHNIGKLKELFPEVFSEGKIKFDQLQELLGNYVTEDEDHYNFTWHGKRRTSRLAQTPSTGTLRPCKEQSLDWDNTQNLFIEGDNLEVLKLLQKSYHRLIKMIYIDPPYNTGNDFIYEDDFKDGVRNYLELTGQLNSEGKKMGTNSGSAGRYHTNWLNMMYPRLKLARNLLRDDGVIFISIDDGEAKNLRSLCDDVFGEENFVDTICWKKKYGGGAKEKYLVSVHEYIFVYAKNKVKLPEILVAFDEQKAKRFYKFKDENYKKMGYYRTHPLEAVKSFDLRDNLRFPVEAPDGTEVWPKRQWRWSKERFEEAFAKNEVIFNKGKDGEWVLSSKQYLNDENGEQRKTKAQSLIDDIYTQEGTKEIFRLFGDAKIFPFPKPTKLLKRIIEISGAKERDIILDFFAGSATTADAVMKTNEEGGHSLNCISIQFCEPTDKKSEAFQAGYKNIADISKDRIRYVAKRIHDENPEFKGDLGFKVFKLDSSNIKRWEANFDTLEEDLFNAVDYIKQDRTSEDILFELLLKYGLKLTVPIKTHTIEDKTVYSIGLGALVVCLEEDISMDVVNGIGALKEELKPEIMHVVFKDDCFKDDVIKTNALQTLKRYGIEDIKSF